MRYLTIITLLSFYSCSDKTPDPKPDGSSEFSFLALGDSYTIGEGVIQDDSWPFLLKESMSASGVELKPVDVVAQTGWTTSELLGGIAEEDPNGHDIVSLLIGVNDQFRNRPMQTFETEFIVLLDKAFELAGSEGRVLVISIPDYGVTPFGSNNSEKIERELNSYNDFMRMQAESKNIPFANITEISREMGAGPGALATDDLHPSRLQYTRWVEEQIKPAVLELIN